MSTEQLQITLGDRTFAVMPGYLYDEQGVWVRCLGQRGTVRLGLSDFRQHIAGDAAFIDLPPVGLALSGGDEIVNVETSKTDLDVLAPFACVITALNEQLAVRPELLNQDPYGEGWLIEVRPAAWPPPGLLDAAAYLEVMVAQAKTL